jgi:hypothetical protein
LEDRHCFCFAFVSRPDYLVLVKVWLWLRLRIRTRTFARVKILLSGWSQETFIQDSFLGAHVGHPFVTKTSFSIDSSIIEPSFFWYESLHWEYSFPGFGSPPSPFISPVKVSFWNRMNPIVDGVKLDETLVLSCCVVRSRVVEGITDTGWSAESFVPSLLWF